MATSLFDQSTDPDSYRRRLAAALMTQGMDTSPVGHWTQGAARMANALVGGLMQRQLKGEQDAKDKEFAAALSILPGLGGGGAAPMPQQAASLDQASVDRSVPASIRYNNPGAQYPGPSATAMGSTGHGVIGGGHKIAQFPTPEAGAAAQFDLLNRGYTGMTLGQALARWSGNNNAPAYIASVAKATGLTPDTPITPQLLQSPQGIVLAQAMAQHEAGRPFPMTAEQWQAAQARAFGGGGGSDTLAGGDTLQGGGAAPARQQVDIPPQVQQQIRTFFGSRDPRVKQLGMQLYQQYAKPQEPKSLTQVDQGTRKTLVNPLTGEPVREFPVDIEGEVTAREQAKRKATEGMPGTTEDAAKLRGEIRQLSGYKSMATVVPRYNAMARAKDDRAGDLTMVYGFMKLLDPESVVRESEVSMAQNIATLPENFRAQVQSFLTGKGRLAADVRAAIMGEATTAAEEYRQLYEMQVQQYRDIVNSLKLQEGHVIPQFAPFAQPAPRQPAPAVPGTVDQARKALEDLRRGQQR